MTAQYDTHGNVAVITLNNPPINSLSLRTRLALVSSVARAQADRTVEAIVVTGGDEAFSGGGDIREFGTPESVHEPIMNSVISAFEACGKPIVAAIAGVCMGGGLELALGCHYRIARPNSQFALPEVKLGLIPGAGGTQRLPRVVGVEQALNMIVSGEVASGEKLASLAGQQLLTALAREDLLPEALALARSLTGKADLPRVRDLSCFYAESDAYFQFVRNTVRASSKGALAPLAGVDAVEAAVTLRFDEGLKFERDLFLKLMSSTQSRALRHAFFSKRAASKIADVPKDTPTRAIQKAAIIGAGTMGGGIAMSFLDADIPVSILETRQDALDRGLAALRKNYEAQIKKGKLRQDQYDRRVSLLRPTLDYADIGDADLVIEAVFEDRAIKEQVFRRLDAVMKPGAILATNTSTLDVDAIAAVTQRPHDVVGMHFFSPANVMQLLEVVRGAKTSGDVLATVMRLAKTIGKVAVVSGVCDGFIGNRMVQQYTRQAGFLLDEGCSPQQVDKAIEAFGFAMGPLRMGDLAGNDVSWAIRKRRYVEKPDLRYSKAPDLLCELGRFGQKTGAGWYDYQSGKRTPIQSDVVAGMLEDHRKSLGIAPRKISDDEIVHRLVFALVNEGAHILEDGIASKAGDIDVIYLTGYGFPALRGGPMFYADTLGLGNVARTMTAFAANPHSDPMFWQPAPLLARLAAEGSTFNQRL